MSAGTARYPAPAVQYPVGRSARLGVILALVHVGGLCVLAAWLVQGAGAQPGAMLLASLLLWVAVAAFSLRFWLRLPTGTLAWDGSAWHLQGAAAPSAGQGLGEVVVVQIDLQRCMALAFPAARPAVWLLVEQQRAPTRWLDVRRAVYSRPSAAKPAPAGAPSEGRSF